MASLNGYLQGYGSDDPPNEQWNEQFEEEELNEQLQDRIPLPPGLQTQRFDSYDEVIEILNAHGHDYGYAVNKKRVKKVKSGSHIKNPRGSLTETGVYDSVTLPEGPECSEDRSKARLSRLHHPALHPRDARANKTAQCTPIGVSEGPLTSISPQIARGAARHGGPDRTVSSGLARRQRIAVQIWRHDGDRRRWTHWHLRPAGAEDARGEGDHRGGANGGPAEAGASIRRDGDTGPGQRGRVNASAGDDTAGVEGGLNSVISACRTHGTIVNIAVWEKDPALHVNELMYREVQNMQAALYDEMPFQHTLEALSYGQLDPRGMITSKISLEEAVEKGFKVLVDERDRHCKILVNLRAAECAGDEPNGSGS
ncbi:GroES-like protein [Aspergillus affinis]|uniref:GroES-like protein n=1 Tax=Aspergillus affinis TaxID=1070780 RepID=UPI0022FEA7E0|nr:GroES-like protein [Aspergillus affinis]KAI9043844.1 GroES-like protein [Aspergillus affinis]